MTDGLGRLKLVDCDDFVGVLGSDVVANEGRRGLMLM
jgi:hypothetical protein